VKPAPFEYHAPATAADAVALLAELGDGAKVIAGGQSLVPVLAMRLAVFDHLIDIRKIAELRAIQEHDDCVWIGAGTTEAEVGGSGLIARRVPLLSRATPLIGHFQIRNRGTIGGSLAHADAAAEYPAVALTLNARLEALSPRGQRTIAAAEFFTGIWETALRPDELLTGISFPAIGAGAPGKVAGSDRARTGGYGGSSPRERAGFAIEEFARRSGDFAIAGAAVAADLDDSARISRLAIGLFGLGPTPLRAAAAEAAAAGVAAADADAGAGEIGQAAVADLDSAPSDLHGSGDYRKKVGAAMVAKAVRRAVTEALAATASPQEDAR
jgi:aerobic carbon-monoxide dehydrogenase medium subunit